MDKYLKIIYTQLFINSNKEFDLFTNGNIVFFVHSSVEENKAITLK